MFTVDYDEEGTIRLVGDASVRDAEALRDALLLAIGERREAWTLDLSALERLDTCAAQLLLSFKRSTPGVRAHSCSPEVRAFLEGTGLAEHLL
jgi:anti-anti-sigma regulatory factor